MKITQKWIASITQGQSFADVGGLWGTTNERVTDAAKAGAASLTMADIQPVGHELWDKFRARCKEHGIVDVRCVTADIMSADAVNRIGRHDVVHCSGVIYHVPDPIGLLRQLRDLTNNYLILVSMVIPERVETEAGILCLQGGQVLFVPALDDHQLAVLSKFYREQDLQIGSIVNYKVETWTKSDGTPKFGPWWWLFTPFLLRRMIETSGFCVVEDSPVVLGRTHGFLCQEA